MNGWRASLLLGAMLVTAAAPSPVVQRTGAPRVAFVHETQACEAWDVPDAPARAVRLAHDRVLLFATHFRNRVAAGRDLGTLHHACGIVYGGAESGVPARFDDRAWIVAVHRANGGRLIAVLHNEFQGHRHPGLCPSGRYIDCWYNALALAASEDGGGHFIRLPGILAVLPYRYDQVTGKHRGYFGFSGFVGWNGAEYGTTFATEAGLQRPGNCLLRASDPGDASTWRAWDGHGFGARFVDPYAAPVADPAAHVCAPVGVGALRWPVTSLVRRAASGRFIAVMMDTARDGGVYVSSSVDLLAWSQPVRILAASGPAGWRCGDPPPIDYPSLLDPDSRDADFDTVSDTAWLFFTRFNPTGCRLLADRDLLRVPVRIATVPAPPAGP